MHNKACSHIHVMQEKEMSEDVGDWKLNLMQQPDIVHI